MSTATLTSKGQITIPKIVRESLGLRTGDRVSFVLRDRAGALLTPVSKSIDEVYGRLHRPGTKARSVDEMNRAIARRMRGAKV